MVPAIVAALLLVPLPAGAAALVQTIVTDPLTGVALEGYDPVSYFTEAEPLAGSPDYEFVWQGVPWYFATAANRDVFMRHPEVYAPQYGGHCAMSLSRGFLSDGKPRLYVIERMKLYLFYSVANREAFFAQAEPALTAANQNWGRLAPELMGAQPGIAEAMGQQSEDGPTAADGER
ncbi:MAG: YHS domain-containing (seleno)protein [Devosia sp.]